LQRHLRVSVPARNKPAEDRGPRRREEAGGMSGALQAIIFDFDGVIANSEPLHMMAFQHVLHEEGVALTPADYYARYVGSDDEGVFNAIARDRALQMNEADVAALVARKGERMEEMLHSGGVLFPGAIEFILEAAAAVPIGIASGAQRHEIIEIISGAGIRDLFSTVVAS